MRGILGLVTNAALLGLLMSPSARADTVVLTNQESYVGRILEDNAAGITISSGGVAWTIKRALIASATRDAAEAEREEAAAEKHRAELLAAEEQKRNEQRDRRIERHQAFASDNEARQMTEREREEESTGAIAPPLPPEPQPPAPPPFGIAAIIPGGGVVYSGGNPKHGGKGVVEVAVVVHAGHGR